jgi:hypothetical protein
MIPSSLGLSDITEKLLTTQVVDLARMTGWMRYHTYRSTKSAGGWPDEALLRERLILVELKAAGGKVSDAQKTWLRALLKAGQETYIVRPADVQTLAVILAHRGNPLDRPSEARDAAVYLQEKTRKEVA